jgi:hypothetical protein
MPIANRFIPGSLFYLQAQLTPRSLALPISLGLSCIPTALLAQPLPAARPSDFQISQEIIEGLPPPPTTTTPNTLPQPAESELSPNLQPDLIAPPIRDRSPQESSSNEERFFLVLINGNSPLLLNQVRRVEAGAFLQNREGQQIIQAGLFRQREGAKQQADALEEQGIEAEIVAVEVPVAAVDSPPLDSSDDVSFSDLVPVTLPTQAPAQEVVFGQSSSFESEAFTGEETIAVGATTAFSSNRRYYVVIPGRVAEIGGILDRTTQLSLDLIGDVEQAIQEREMPRGIHVIVGPFVDRQAAFRWDRYFRTFGLVDSRVYYRH